MKFELLSDLLIFLNKYTYLSIQSLNKKEEVFLDYLLNKKPELKFIEYYYKNKKASYLVFKKRFIEKATKLIYNAEYHDSYFVSKYRKEIVDLEKALVNCRIVTSNRNRQVGTAMYEYLLPKAFKLEHYDAQITILTKLREHYSIYNKASNSKITNLKSRYLKAISNRDLELYARELYIELSSLISKNIYNSVEEVIKKYKTSISELLYKISSVDSYFTKYYGLNAAYYYYTITKNKRKLQEICEEAIHFFKQKKGFNNLAIYSFNLKLGINHLNNQKYQNAESCFLGCLKYNIKNSIVIHAHVSRYLFSIYLYQNKYESAFKTLGSLTSKKTFKTISPIFAEPWYLKEAFIHFLIRTGKINLKDHPDIQLRPFRIHRFLNEVPVFSKDKKGVNITINIIQVLFLIADKKYEKATDKLNSLKQYSYRYLRKKEFVRPRSFISMLLTLPTAHFNARFVNERSRKHLQTLKGNPMDYSEKSINIEIIPYEQLWEEVLSLL